MIEAMLDMKGDVFEFLSCFRGRRGKPACRQDHGGKERKKRADMRVRRIHDFLV